MILPLRYTLLAGLFLACTRPPLEQDSGTGPVVDVDDPAEHVAAVPDRVLEAPGLMALDCLAEIPVEGKVDCALRVTWPDGEEIYNGPAAVGLHGRSSAGFPKHQYAIELRTLDGVDADTDLYGMGEDADWLLNGMYLDRALFRNKLAYDLFREMGASRALGNAAPEAAYVEVALNGVYSGVYLLTERVERGADRVDIPEDDGTGARFIVRADEEGIPSAVQYAHWAPVYPDPPAPAGVATRLGAFEATLLGTGRDAFTEADLDGFVDFVILEETLKNNDGYFLSHHLYTGQDELLRFVPWDLDLTLGQPSYNNNELVDQWILYRPDLIARPALQEPFRTRLAERWLDLRGGILASDALIARMEGYRALLGDAVTRNWAVWDITQVPNVGFPLYAVATPEEEYAAVEAWTRQRLTWMDENIQAY